MTLHVPSDLFYGLFQTQAWGSGVEIPRSSPRSSPDMSTRLTTVRISRYSRYSGVSPRPEMSIVMKIRKCSYLPPGPLKLARLEFLTKYTFFMLSHEPNEPNELSIQPVQRSLDAGSHSSSASPSFDAPGILRMMLGDNRRTLVS